MRIDLLGSTPIAETPASGAASQAVPTQQPQTAVPEDTTSFSTGAAEQSSLVTQAIASAQSRAVKVDALRQAVVNAEFTIDPGLIADAIISSAE